MQRPYNNSNNTDARTSEGMSAIGMRSQWPVVADC